MSTAAVSAVSAIPALGYTPMPADFRYLDTFLQGRPRHERLSEFSRRHPKMDCSRRAKLFAPFDALKWFDERIAKKEVLYEQRKELSDSQKEALDKKLSFLRMVTYRLRLARRPAPLITVTYYCPCTDEEHDSYGSGGQYLSHTGTVRKVDAAITKTITVDDRTIDLNQVSDITGDLFNMPYEGYTEEDMTLQI